MEGKKAGKANFGGLRRWKNGSYTELDGPRESSYQALKLLRVLQCHLGMLGG